VRSPSRPAPRRFSLLLALAAGGLLVLAFPPFGYWPMAAVSAGILSFVVRGRRARSGALYGLVFGLAFFIPLLRWSGTYVGAVPWLLLSVAEALFIAALGAALAVTSRLPYWPVWAAALWVAEEALRDRLPFGGFPWGRLAFSQPDGPFVPFAAFGGAPLVTFAVALTGCLAAYAVQRGLRRDVRVVAALAAAGVLAVPLVGLLLGLSVQTGDRSRQVQIAVVQGNVPRLGLGFNAQREAVLHDHVRQTLALAGQIRSGAQPRPAFVVWPEDASDIDPLDNPDAAALIDQAARAVGVPILVGAILDGPGNHVRNAGIVWDPRTGPGATYLKRHPVPFGEYIPLRSLARLVTSKVDLVPRDMLAGKGSGDLHIGGLTIGDVICFEVAYDGLVADDVDGGAQVLVVQTNNATFGRTAESPQQLAMARIRAVEHDRSVIVSSTSGISAIIAPDGRVRAQSKIFTAARFDLPVAVQSGTTVATRLGAIPEWVLTGVAGIALLTAVVVRRSERGRPAPPMSVHPDRERENA
jgi:apolipoprotein N-acyltransferase